MAICKIVETSIEYNTLADAVAALTAGQTIQMTDNFAAPADVTIDKSCTIDLAGKAITIDLLPSSKGRFFINGTGTIVTMKDSVDEGKISVNPVSPDYSTTCIFNVDNGATLNIESGTYDSTGILYANIGFALKNATINVSGGTLKANAYALTSNGSLSTASVINVTDGVFESTTDYVVYMADKTGTVNISGGKFTGACGAISTNAGELNITGGEFISLGTGNTGSTTTDGTSNQDNNTIAVYGKYTPVTATIENGTFEAQGNANVIKLVTYNASTVDITGGDFKATGENSEIFVTEQISGKDFVPTATVSGGTFNKSFDEKYLAPDTELVQNEDGTFGPAPIGGGTEEPDPEEPGGGEDPDPEEPGGDDDEPTVDLSKKASSYDILVYNSITMPPYNYKDKDWRRDV